MRPSSTRLNLLIGVSAVVIAVLGLAVARPHHAATAPSPQGSRLFMSPDGTDSSRCTHNDPCRSFPYAYSVARAGTVIEVAGGTYEASDQSIPPNASKPTGKAIVFRPASGAEVTITAEVKVGATGLTFERMSFRGGWSARGDRITFRDIVAANISISGSNIRVLGGQVYPGQNFTEEDDPLIGSGSNARKPPTNILIDGVWFHGWLRPPGSDYHVECLQVGAGVNVVIRRSRFSDCATHDIFIRSWGQLNDSDNTLDNWVLENNFFGETRDGYYSVQLLNDLDETGNSKRFLIRNNSWTQDFHIDVRDGTTVKVIANLGVQSQEQCRFSKGDVEWSYNVFTAARCSKTDRRAPARFVNAQTLDLRLKPGAAARDHGDPNNYPPVDIFFNRRPRGTKPDAGAVEAG